MAQEITVRDLEELFSEAEKLREEWAKAVNQLAQDIENTRLLLEIRDPELLQALEEYHIREYIYLAPDAIEEQPDRIRRISRAFDSNCQDGRGFAKFGDYSAAVSRLRNFMQEDLKLTAEEILAS